MKITYASDWNRVEERDIRTLEDLFELIQSNGTGIIIEWDNISEEKDTKEYYIIVYDDYIE